MSGFQAVQGIVILFSIIFFILLGVMVLSRLRRPKPPIAGDSLSNKEKKLNEQNATALKLEDQKLAGEKRSAADETATRNAIDSQKSHRDFVTDAKTDAEHVSESEISSAVISADSGTSEAETSPVALSKALESTRQRFWGRLQALWTSGAALADWDEIEEVLYTSDLGPQTVERLLESVKQNLSRTEKKDAEAVRSALRQEMLHIFHKTQGHTEPTQLFEKFQFTHPSVWMVVGVNGAGKTTSIGKIASQLARSGKKVLVAAGDTFRAAAGSQLKVWTDRAQVEIFSPEGVKDPSAVAFDAVQRGVAKNYDVIIVDTAGRLHTQHNLMEEIKKMKRVIQKVIPEAPHELLLVLDSNQGQNALMQAKEFHKALGVTGVVLTKLDGSAKGGVAVGVAHELELPIKLIGVGEKMEDLRSFSPKNFVESIL